MTPSQITRIVRATQRGVQWLRQCADDISDPRDVAITIIALVAAERNPHSHVVQRLTSTLLSRQSANGSWCDELWDTAWAVKALHAVGHDIEHPAVAQACRFFEATRDPIRGSWYEEPFETILVLEMLTTLTPGRVREIGDEAIAWLISLQKPEGVVIGIRYTGMLVSLLIQLNDKRPGGVGDVVKRAVAWLRNDLLVRPIWTSAAWSNYYALRALLDAGCTIDDIVVGKAVDWFLESQDTDGKWMQVSRIHDTAMAIILLSQLLTAPLVVLGTPKTGVLTASRERDSLRIAFQTPGASALTPSEQVKLSTSVRSELGRNQQELLLMTSGQRTRSKSAKSAGKSRQAARLKDEFTKIGKYAYGHLVPPRIQLLLENCTADHLRLDIDETLTDLPWEIIHDGKEFLCLEYAFGRRIIANHSVSTPVARPRRIEGMKALVVSNPTMDLPSADDEGRRIVESLNKIGAIRVDHYSGRQISKKDLLITMREYDIVHFAGHASYDKDNPDESCIVVSDGEITAYEIAKFIAEESPAIVFLNACWSAEEYREPDAYPSMIRGLGKTFLYAGVSAFIGYLLPVPDDFAAEFAVTFYEQLRFGHTVGESLRRARVLSRKGSEPDDIMWSSAVLYGDPSAKLIALDHF